MNRHVVLVDAGWLKYSTRFAAMKRLGLSSDAPLAQLAEHPSCLAAMYDVMALSIKSRLSALTKYGPIDRCVFCLDVGKSWRIGVPKTKVPGSGADSSIEYKGHRKIEDPVELEADGKLNDIYRKCIDYIASNGGIDLLGKYSIESDDFMIVLSRLYANQGDTVFVVSRDADITQAVYTSDKGGRVIIWQPNPHTDAHLVVDHATFNSVSGKDIFNMSTLPLELQKSIQTAEIVAPQYMLLAKILLGDVSDDISPVMLRTVVSKSGKEIHYKLRSADLAKIYDHFCQKNPEGYFKLDNMYDEDDIKDVLSLCHQYVFKQDFDVLPQDWQQFYFDKFVENRKMVICNKQELGDVRYNDIIKAALEQLHDREPHVDAIPTWDIIQRLKQD